MVPERIEREIVIAASVERDWAALTEAEQIGIWFGDAGAEIDLRPGGALVCRWQEDGAFRARIERVDPHRIFSYRWARPADTEPRPGNSMVVEFTLTPDGRGTRLCVVESGFRDLDLPDEEKRAWADGNVDGWIEQLGEIGAYAEKLAA